METIYLGIVLFLFVLAIFDLVVGVSNDAVNFLNSAIGAKAASFKTIIFIAGVGVFIGAALSNGMMDIARHGIYQPQHFYFAEIMCILLAVMLTDVVLLDVFNTMGMPTSTTVSMVFELLGGTFALSLIKVYSSEGTLGLGDLINTDKALSVIMAHHGHLRVGSHCVFLRYAGTMVGTYHLYVQLQEAYEVQHRHFRRYSRYEHHLLHADKRTEGQFLYDSRIQPLDTSAHAGTGGCLFRVLHRPDAGAPHLQGERF